jgi:hypothetical protein
MTLFLAPRRRFFRTGLVTVLMGLVWLCAPPRARADAVTYEEPWMDKILKEYMPFLFEKKEGPQPEDTLIAPFADPALQQEAQTKDPGKPVLPVNAVPLNLPHRTAREVARWIMIATAESLSFDTGTFDARQKKVATYFTPEAYQKYLTFLDTGFYREKLRSGSISLHNFVREEPFMINNGVVDGSYRWLFEVPVMLSYLPAGTSGYKDQDPTNEELVFRIEVMRSPGSGPEEILISNWSASAASK